METPSWPGHPGRASRTDAAGGSERDHQLTLSSDRAKPWPPSLSHPILPLQARVCTGAEGPLPSLPQDLGSPEPGVECAASGPLSPVSIHSPECLSGLVGRGRLERVVTLSLLELGIGLELWICTGAPDPQVVGSPVSLAAPPERDGEMLAGASCCPPPFTEARSPRPPCLLHCSGARCPPVWKSRI